MGIIGVFFKPNARRILVTAIFILLSLLYSSREEQRPFKTEWIWNDQPLYHSSSPLTHVGLPGPYLSKGDFQAAGVSKPEFMFLGCDNNACIFELSGQRRWFLYHLNIGLNLVFWYLFSCLLIFIFAKFRKRAHSWAG